MRHVRRCRRHILEADLGLVGGVQPRPALPEGEYVLSVGREPPEHSGPEPHQKQQRQEGQKHASEGEILRGPGHDVYLLVFQGWKQLRVSEGGDEGVELRVLDLVLSRSLIRSRTSESFPDVHGIHHRTIE